jgi:hypothetical protein
MSPPAETACPICGEPNQCAAAQSGSFDKPCWCMEVEFTEQVLSKLPAGDAGVACVCRACAITGGQ